MDKRSVSPGLHSNGNGTSNGKHHGDSHAPFVMVVDDESSIADTLGEILTRSGYRAVTAYDGESALESALLKPPSVLIADVNLPGMSGIDLAITVRRMFPDCNVILFSGHAATADLLAGANRMGHHFVLLSKPVRPSELLAQVAQSMKPVSHTSTAVV